MFTNEIAFHSIGYPFLYRGSSTEGANVFPKRDDPLSERNVEVFMYALKESVKSIHIERNFCFNHPMNG
jgi:hypothetical protein